MRRLALVGASVVVLSSGVFAEVAVAQEGYGPSGCSILGPGEVISEKARTVGYSDESNPGNPKDPLPPDVPTFCNPLQTIPL